MSERAKTIGYKHVAQVPPGDEGGSNLIDIEGQSRTQVALVPVQHPDVLPPLDGDGGGAEPGVPPREGEVHRPAGGRHRGRQPDLQGPRRHGARPGERDLIAMYNIYFQGEIVDSIEANVESASIRVNEGSEELRMAERYQVS